MRLGVQVIESFWLGGRDSNPNSQIQSLESYHWTTSQQGSLNLRIARALVNWGHKKRNREAHEAQDQKKSAAIKAKSC